jgi:hypothetical protein
VYVVVLDVHRAPLEGLFFTAGGAKFFCLLLALPEQQRFKKNA